MFLQQRSTHPLCLFHSQHNELSGGSKIEEENIRSRQKELNDPVLRNAEEKYKEKLIEFTVSDFHALTGHAHQNEMLSMCVLLLLAFLVIINDDVTPHNRSI